MGLYLRYCNHDKKMEKRLQLEHKLQVVNPDDRMLYDHAYSVSLDPHLWYTYLVYADCEQDALDELADWCEENAPGYLVEEDSIFSDDNGDHYEDPDGATIGRYGNHGVGMLDDDISIVQVD